MMVRRGYPFAAAAAEQGYPRMVVNPREYSGRGYWTGRPPSRTKGGRQHMGMIADWPSMAACRNGDPDALFVQGAEQNIAKRICRGCPVRYECLADALDNRIEFGVWGGMTERERRALLRRHPGVPSWRRMFEAAMDKKHLIGAP